ncbi:substrate-binding domain-containing protein [Microbacterium sp. gxy059]|uniref:substrate-binding domain-containing protein n=1 Tax=Microbacterium sp. gxy059 TaxID=2957199 RepID=UPI003D97811A
MREAPVATIPSPREIGGSSSEALAAFLDDFLAAGARAAIVLPDGLAISLLSVIERRGLRVPEDFAIVAYDDEIASLASVPLTAIAPPKAAVGRRALETCFMRLESRDASPSHRIALAPSLTLREST